MLGNLSRSRASDVNTRKTRRKVVARRPPCLIMFLRLHCAIWGLRLHIFPQCLQLLKRIFSSFWGVFFFNASHRKSDEHILLWSVSNFYNNFTLNSSKFHLICSSYPQYLHSPNLRGYPNSVQRLLQAVRCLSIRDGCCDDSCLALDHLVAGWPHKMRSGCDVTKISKLRLKSFRNKSH